MWLRSAGRLALLSMAIGMGAAAEAQSTEPPAAPASAASSVAASTSVVAGAAAPAAGASGVVADAPVAAPSHTLLLRSPVTPELHWRGMLATEGGAVGGGAQIGLYPVAGTLGLLAAILTHAAINEGVKSAEQTRLQAEADKVLQPYLPALANWQAAQLWAAVQTRATAEVRLEAAEPGQGAPGATAVQVVPKFTLSQDEGVLIADIALRFEGGEAAVPVEQLVRVVSSPLPTTEARTHWLADDARSLKQATASMIVHAVRLSFLRLRSPGAEVPARTHRYLRGKVQSMERGQLLHSDCARLLVQTLRGHLLSVPRVEHTSTSCTEHPGF